ncbi:MAG: N-acetylmuramoyl-L-alanine amidase [Maribacter sp.]|jgi:N-acetylmuramoyl-L-alanine amidase
MRFRIKRTILQTQLIILLPVLALLFNSYALQGKSKSYSEKDAREAKITSTIHQFGQSRFQNKHQKQITTAKEAENLFQMDWSNYTLKTVVIDPGHGGKDEGTISPDGTQEKNIALSIAQKLGSFIQANYPEVKVIYTRYTDVFIPLNKRAKIANDNKADLFISIHCNSFRLSSVKGAETYVMGLHRAEENMEVIKRENDVVLLEEDYEIQYEEYGVDKDSPLYDILINSYQNAYLEQSLSFAAMVDSKIKSQGYKTRGVHQAGFVVLRRTVMPSILVEVGYLSNQMDRNRLVSYEGQTAMANQLYRAFVEYKSSIDTRRTGRVIIKEEPKKVLVENKIEKPEPVKKKSDIQFCIQVTSSDEELDFNEEKWIKIKDRLTIEKSSDGVKRYVLKDYGTNYKKAKVEKTKLRESGFTGCFVIAMKENKRIELYKAKKELGLN